MLPASPAFRASAIMSSARWPSSRTATRVSTMDEFTMISRFMVAQTGRIDCAGAFLYSEHDVRGSEPSAVPTFPAQCRVCDTKTKGCRLYLARSLFGTGLACFRGNRFERHEGGV